MIFLKGLWDQLWDSDIGPEDKLEGLNIINKQMDKVAATITKVGETRRVWSSIANSVADMSKTIGQAIGGMEMTFEDMAMAVVGSIMSVVSALLVETVIALAAHETVKSGLLGLLIAGTIGLSAVMALLSKSKAEAAKATKGVKMAGGGVVPSGYPNDTYPALLTSGETVTPPGALSNLGRQPVAITVQLEDRKSVV